MLCGIEGQLYAASPPCQRNHRIPVRRSAIFAALSLMISSKGRLFHRRYARYGQTRPPKNSWISQEGQRFTCSALASPQKSPSYRIPTSAATTPNPRARCARLRICLPSAIRKSRADGEMQGDSALSEAARELILPHSRLKGVANVLIMPNLDAGNAGLSDDQGSGRRAPCGNRSCSGPARPAHVSDAIGDRAAASST